MGSQRVGHNWATELNWTEPKKVCWEQKHSMERGIRKLRSLSSTQSLTQENNHMCFSRPRGALAPFKASRRIQHSWSELGLWWWEEEKVKVLAAQLCLILCDPMDCSLPDSSVLGISQAITLEWVAMPSSRGSSLTSDQTQVSCTAGGYFSTQITRKPPGKSISYLLSRWPELSFQSLSNLFSWTTNSLRAGIRFLCSMLPCKYATCTGCILLFIEWIS